MVADRTKNCHAAAQASHRDPGPGHGNAGCRSLGAPPAPGALAVTHVRAQHSGVGGGGLLRAGAAPGHDRASPGRARRWSRCVHRWRRCRTPIGWRCRRRHCRPCGPAGFIVHGAHDRSASPCGGWAIEIEAGEAFGTAHNATTVLCLEALDRLIRRRRFARVLDLGLRHRRARHRCGAGAAQRARPGERQRSRGGGGSRERMCGSTASASRVERAAGDRLSTIRRCAAHSPSIWCWPICCPVR